MTIEATDKETQPATAAAPVDEVVGASQSSSQSSEDPMKTSQGTESSDVQEAEERAAVNDQPNVEMDEAKEETESKGKSQDVDMESVAEEKTEDNEEEKPTADTVEKADDIDNTPSDEKPVGTDGLEMKAADETAQESKSEVNGAPVEEVNVEKSVGEGETPMESNETDTEAKQVVQLSSPKRKERVLAPEANNKVTASEEPAAKKQKIGTADPKSPDKEAKTTATGTEAVSPSVMLSRDDMAKLEEDSGRLKFDVISNDGSDEHMIQLTTLKNIFAKQLPKMPKEYIVRLVFDKNHRSMLLLKNGTHVIGGICYRPFEKNQFAEIAFCAINASDQVKGYGTRLMNHLKEYVKTKNITHFLTYADNYAIGYFKKQGFTKSVSMARPNWYGYIKDYDGGTLMECTIHTQINYLRITSMIHRQRKVIQDKIQERSHAKVVYPGLTQFAEGRLMDIYMVPGVKEAGWSQATIRNNRIGTRDQGSLKSQLSQLLKAVSNHRSAWPFHEPVDTTVVVDYLEHIKDPVDLQLISKRIDSGVYISKSALKTDLERMCDNCTTYNTPDTNYYKAAIDLREFIQTRIQIRDHN